MNINTIFLVILLLLTGCHQIKNHENMSKSGYVNVKEGKLHYQSYGSGEPIIVIHGGPGMMDSSYLIPEMRELAKQNQVIFYDQRGSGKSLATVVNSKLINLEQFTRDLDDLRKNLKLDKVILLGHSWGGLIAMNYAAKYPQHLNKLILLSTAPADYQGIMEFEKKSEEKTKNIAREIAPLYTSQTIAKLDIEEIKRLYSKVFEFYVYKANDAKKITLGFDKKSAVSAVQAMEELAKDSWNNPDFNLFPKLKNIKAPTLIIHGKEDIIPLWTIQKIKDVIPNAKELYIDDCGHFPHVEQKERTLDAIAKFSIYS